jgi:hypothetical protein
MCVLPPDWLFVYTSWQKSAASAEGRLIKADIPKGGNADEPSFNVDLGPPELGVLLNPIPLTLSFTNTLEGKLP